MSSGESLQSLFLAEHKVGLLRSLVLEAGVIAARDFHRDARTSAQVWSKLGGSPVTQADLAVDAFLKRHLSSLLPDAAWLSEETADDAQRLRSSLVWVVDPIDGTRAFVAGHPDWAVCVALLDGGVPVWGMVHAPALDRTYEARMGEGAWANGQPIAVSPATTLSGARMAGPRFMIDARSPSAASLVFVPKVPSLALRLARIADGSIDVGVVSPGAWDWDLTAADLILTEAGGALRSLAGQALHYNQPKPIHEALVAGPLGLIDSLLTTAQDIKPSP